ncbi:MAG: hypothetical protein ACJ78R_06265, partial [Gemmatimonadaceae bacterium]
FFVRISIPDGLTKSAFISRLSAILSLATTLMAEAEDVVWPDFLPNDISSTRRGSRSVTQ